MGGIVAEKPKVVEPVQKLFRKHDLGSQVSDPVLEIASLGLPLLAEFLQGLPNHDRRRHEAFVCVARYSLIKRGEHASRDVDCVEIYAQRGIGGDNRSAPHDSEDVCIALGIGTAAVADGDG
jgi:hypothetical protein